MIDTQDMLFFALHSRVINKNLCDKWFLKNEEWLGTLKLTDLQCISSLSLFSFPIFLHVIYTHLLSFKIQRMRILTHL